MDLIKNEAELREIYARWLDCATKAGFAISLAAFLVYVTGLAPAFVPPSELPRYWTLPVDRFVAATGAPQQWAWLHFLRYSDVLNVGAVLLCASGAEAPCATRLAAARARVRAGAGPPRGSERPAGRTRVTGVDFFRSQSH